VYAVASAKPPSVRMLTMLYLSRLRSLTKHNILGLSVLAFY
jgi:hypothetical protein